ncbi:FAD:protein FMN transferase [Cochleicola gelatinilyticus]|uniref:FAD:protein FMN transferase n=1 Tax=Cochleicola gelatinilyticus TaxID=1763537 RepID=A0A167F383_9FLAO|nr:FAD:protein FMN transferase [Cochleicola gelatinilyticus]OAB76144.1 thiamine biosynthesis protein ApbE [Cochleicola gelatinilyticus]
MRILTLLVISVLFVSCISETPKLKIIQGNAFGTTYAIQYEAITSEGIKKGIDSVINAVNMSVSTYLPESDISKINRGDTTVVVNQIFIEVFRLSETIHNITNGYFDPTIGVLRNAYGFGDTKPLKQLDASTVDSLMQYVGFSKVVLTSKKTIQKENPHLYLDFNAIAKGYGIDCIGTYLTHQGIDNFLIELGGELLAKGQHPEKNKPWVAGIEAVTSQLEDRRTRAAVQLSDRAMAASGNYRKFRIDSVSGKKYVHTLNPLTGSAEKSDVTSATVIAKTCAEADAYATSFMALGLERSKNVLKSISGIEAYLTYNDSLQNEQVFITKGFNELVLSNTTALE